MIAHTDVVAALAGRIADRLQARGHSVDRDLVRAGAHLHDVGRSRTQGIDHASVGAQLLREAGYPEALCLVVERHTGGGIDAKEARTLHLPVKDYTPQTLEDKVVCQADNLVDGERRQKVQEELADLRHRGLDRVASKIEALHRELSTLCGVDLDEL